MKKTLIVLMCLMLFSACLASAETVSKDDPAYGVAQRPLEIPEYVEGRQAGNLCVTMEGWYQRLAEKGLSEMSLAALCHNYSACDDPAVRDATPIDPLAVNVVVHVLCEDDGSGCAVNQATVDATIDQMNADYAYNNTGIQFNLAETYYHNNSSYVNVRSTMGGFLSDVQAVKNLYAVSPELYCNIYITGLSSAGAYIFYGYATFPWDSYALETQGGLWLNKISCGTDAKTAPHEMGHCLGLWHTFNGVDEGATCGDDCYEYADGREGDYRGDMCGDTPPTPTNRTCAAPGGTDCEGTEWGRTLYEDLMGYSGDECMDSFTVSQTLRMQCWTKYTLSGWLGEPCDVTAAFSGEPVNGEAPLLVQFTDLSQGPVSSWYWDFGDDGYSTDPNPSHEFTADGDYTVSLTVYSATCDDTETKINYISVGSGPDCTMHVEALDISRVAWGRNCYGLCTVTIFDNENQPLEGAEVDISVYGISTGSTTGTTGPDGTVTFQTSTTKSCSGEWCFVINDVTHPSCTYDPDANVVTEACESGPVYMYDDAIAAQAGNNLLSQNYPNPFNPTTAIAFTLDRASKVKLEVYNITGQKVADLIDGNLDAGEHAAFWDASNYASGVYLYKLTTDDVTETRKMILLK